MGRLALEKLELIAVDHCVLLVLPLLLAEMVYVTVAKLHLRVPLIALLLLLVVPLTAVMLLMYVVVKPLLAVTIVAFVPVPMQVLKPVL